MPFSIYLYLILCAIRNGDAACVRVRVVSACLCGVRACMNVRGTSLACILQSVAGEQFKTDIPLPIIILKRQRGDGGGGG